MTRLINRNFYMHLSKEKHISDIVKLSTIDAAARFAEF